MVSEIASLREMLERTTAELAKLNEPLSQRDARIAELERLLSGSDRSGKRQAATFSKGDPKEEPAPPGRRSGEPHSRHGHRMAPVGLPDREIDVPLPSCCPDYEGEVEHERSVEQFQVELPEMRPVTTTFRVGRCRNCSGRVRARHAELTSDALGAASSQVGPTAQVLGCLAALRPRAELCEVGQPARLLGVKVSAGALCQAAQSSSTELVPVHASIVKAVNDTGHDRAPRDGLARRRKERSVMKGKRNGPKWPGYSKAQYEISGAGRIDYQYNPASAEGTERDVHGVVKMPNIRCVPVPEGEPFTFSKPRRRE